MTDLARIGRRDLLAGVSTVGVGAVAGCSGSETPDNGGGASDETEPTATATETSEDDTQHEVGESFEVGSGAKSIRYVVENASLARAIGTSSFNVEADGLFLVVILRMENTGTESIDITARHLRLVDSQGREFDADSEASTYINQDSRFDAEGILFEQLQPGLEQTRAVPFDVATEESYALKVAPAGAFSGAEAHYVALGNVPSPS
ncbi:DUF4352 domain-containing protein [Haloplanus sp. C73]|uniref:DUF4352 domain-containing protein n=1 Tax=Haloplanus sp. C73 TaxID=3421641 RepID=UPI003EBEE5C2